ncbi:MAG: group 1 truncated hemoglobin [Marinobacter sp.]|uniref:group I truncated hemoglobin n=1 Tax=Marinobacter sp. TaxID=50741 RepID=UPI00299DAFB2|nr:group 1 truncated hemoglobin [Marinobacter sp.]MDX1634142.1 group 1 truncated hemoglobin [Marinobacter sp.]
MILAKAIVALLLAFTLAACQTPPAAPQEDNPDLYAALGEREGIEAIVEDLLYIIVDDERIAFQFRGLDVARFHGHLSDQICMLAGGPCTYTGRDMAESHSAMAITNTQFNALVEDLILAMEKNRVPTAAQNRLLARLAPMHDAIVRP